jgi:hypothetical protein
MRGNNTFCRYYPCLMYIWHTPLCLYIRTCIGPGLCIMLDVNFSELCLGEVRRIHLPRTPVNKGKKEGRCILVGCPALVFAGQGG